LAAASEQGERFMAAPAPLAYPLMGAAALVGAEQGATAQPDTRVFVVRFMDEPLANSLGERVGLVVKLVNYRWFSNAPTDAFTRLHSAGLSDGRFAAERIKAFDVYAASFPIFASTGEAIVLLETRLPTAQIDASVRHLVNRLLFTALVLVALAVLVSFILGQQVAGPVRALTDAALRLGQGDFSTSIPTGGTAEVVALSRTMEDMRRNLIDLTTTLRLREAEAQAVLQGIVEGVYAVDRSRTIRYLNPQAAKLLNVRAEDAIGRFCGDVLKPRSVHGVSPCDAHCPILEARNAGTAQATEHLMPSSGAPRTSIITSSATVDGLQVQVIRDETELEAVRRARDTVLANISHEFRTPLAAQLASIELLRDGLDTMPAEQLRELVLSLERGTHRLTTLIDNLLESVRIESGQLGIRKQSIDLREAVDDAKELIGSLLAQRDQVLQVHFAEGLPYVEGDGPRLVQVFVNLLANASKFAPEGSVLRVGADAGGNVVTAWVEDEGPGVPEMQSGSIFDRFHRGPDQEPEPGGLGLGLWIVKSIIERHGGTISAARTPQNHTRFSFTLPAAAEGE
jgi:signal transduction histidine kinase